MYVWLRVGLSNQYVVMYVWLRVGLPKHVVPHVTKFIDTFISVTIELPML